MKPRKRVRLTRPAMQRATEEVRRWAALLETELCSWPQVTTRPMFGMTAVFRRGRIFAALPRTRALGTPDSVAFKLSSISPSLQTRLEKDARIVTRPVTGHRWIAFELHHDSDLNQALRWFEHAYKLVH